jgi:WD40 repeat protein
VKQLSGHQGSVFDLAFSPDGAFLVSCGAGGSIRLWDVRAGEQLKQIVVGTDTLYAIAFHPGGEFVAVSGVDEVIYLFDVLTGEKKKALEASREIIYRLRFNAKGDRLLSCGYGGTLSIWDPNTGKALLVQPQHRVTNDADWSPDEKQIVAASNDGFAYLIEVQTMAAP